jgi:Zn-dependent protease with chaperone function
MFPLRSMLSPGLLTRSGFRWRIILLSPEEEDQIAAQLAGEGWYQAVGEILTSQAEDGKMPTPIPVTDWRYQWVQSTLRRLESVVPILQDETKLNPSWLETGPDEVQLPPPAEFPLRPRPRASEYLKMISDMTCGKVKHTPDNAPHTVTGPPYSLLLIDKPDASNAFSYGFGPDGGGGIVVYSAFIDEILSDPSLAPSRTSRDQSEETSWWSYLFGSVLNTNHHQHPAPSPEQTDQLAVLLAHELSHLILSHHLESLTSSSIVLPGLLSLVTDLVRTLMFPVTMLFGPFVNDAVANMGKIGTGEAAKLSVLCTTRAQELEADVVSTRLLAYAGFDPHSTVKFWESKTPTTYGDVSECAAWKEDSNAARIAEGDRLSDRSALSLFGSTHPMNDTRVGALTKELLRWSAEKEETLVRLRTQSQQEVQGAVDG